MPTRRRRYSMSSIPCQERIRCAFLADRGGFAVPWIHDGVVGELEQFPLQRMYDSLERTTPKVRAANASGEQRVPRKQLAGSAPGGFRGARDREHGGGVRWHVQANTARGVAGGMKNLRFVAAPANHVTLADQLIDLHF